MTHSTVPRPDLPTPGDPDARRAFDARILRGAAVNALGMVANGVQPFVLVAATRLYGPAVVGAYVVAATIIRMLESALTSGYAEALVLYGARYAHREDSEELQERLYVGASNAFAATVGLSALGLGIAWLPGVLASVFPDPAAQTAVKLALIGLPFAAGRELVIAMTRSLMIMRYNALLDDVVLPWTSLAFVVVGAWVSPTIEVLVGAIVLSQIVTAACSVWVYARLFSVARLMAAYRTFRFDRELNAFALPQNLNATLVHFAGGADVVMLTVTGVPLEQVAFYGVASGFIRDLRTIRRGFGAVFAPLVARLHDEGRMRELTRHFVATSRWTMMITIPVTIVLVALMGDLLLVYHPTFTMGTAFVAVLALNPLIGAAIGMAATVLLMTGHARYNLANGVVGAVLSVGLAAWLVPPYGIMGAAVAVVLSGVAPTLLALVECHYLERVGSEIEGLARPLLAGVLAALVVGVGFATLPIASKLGGRLALVAMGVTTFVGGLIVLGVDPEDRAALSAAVFGRRRRDR